LTDENLSVTAAMKHTPPLTTRLQGAVAWTGSLLALGLALTAPTLSGFTQGSAPPSRPAVSNGLIVGRVVDADGGTPLPGVVVTVTLPASATARGNSGPGVIDSQTLVQIAQVGGGGIGVGNGGPTVQVLTGSDGWFVFHDLPAGSLTFRASLSGYAGGGYNQRLPDLPGQPLILAEGQQLGDVTLRMWKLASISGTVTDERGDPVVGAFVRVLRRAMVGGRPVITMSGFGRPTDDRGQYRAFGLTPGEYVVCVPATALTTPVSAGANGPNMIAASPGESIVLNGGPMGNGSGQRVGDLLLQTGAQGRGSAVPPPVSDTGKIFVYPTVFYPSASTSAHATVITVTSGEAKTAVDMQLPLLPTVRVSGIVVAPDGPSSGLQVHLVSADPDQGLLETAPDDVAMSITDGQGQFTFLGVPKGQYQIKVTRATPQMLTQGPDGGFSISRGSAPMLWGAAAVAADQTDVTGLSLALQPGYTIGGRVVFEGSSPQPNAQQLGRSNMRLMDSQAGAGRAVGPGMPQLVLNADGTFSATGYVPGRYTVIPPQWPALKWVAKSIVMAGTDVSDAPIDLTGDVTNLTVTFTDQPAHMTGTVRDGSGKPDPNSVVVVFPPDPRAWGWPNGLHTRSTPVTATGTFALSNLPPGDYAVAAIPDGWQNTWRDPAILARLLPVAARVQLRDGETRTEDLRQVTIK
jgi:hypothetical protein